jgi:conjugative relaxase-like TrwC/TraI family protein
VLSIGKLSAGADSAAYYLEVIANGRDDYYLAGHEAPGRWMGSAAAHLGLVGVVEPEDLKAVLAGTDPRSGERLARWRSVAGFDLTLSAPKSVSLLWALGSAEVATAVVEAHDAAVAAAVDYLEDEACSVRRGRGGADQLGGAGFVSAAFRHRTSRANDPNLHTHLVTANMTLGADGRWSSLDGGDLYRHGRTAGFVYQSVLRHEVAERLGVAFGPTGPGVGEVVGVSERARRAFSRRRVAVEATMGEHGSHSARGAQVAVLASRPTKNHTVGEEGLRRDWRTRALDIGFTLDDVPQRRVGEWPSDDTLLGRELTRHDATFDRRTVIRAVAEAATQGLPYVEIRSRADAFLAGPEAVEVAPGRWTTPEMLALEADALNRATAGGRSQPVSEVLVDDALRARPTISDEQADAVRRITTSDASVVVLVGRAGTGKTFALDAARAAWHSAELRPIGVALAARAAQELQSGSGIQSVTIAGLLTDLGRGERRITDRDVVVVDEAGMVGTRDLHRLITVTTEAEA